MHWTGFGPHPFLIRQLLLTEGMLQPLCQLCDDSTLDVCDWHPQLILQLCFISIN